jgi:hypothetical protein
MINETYGLSTRQEEVKPVFSTKQLEINEFGAHTQAVLQDDTTKLQKAMDERKKQFIREIPADYRPQKHMEDQWRWHPAFRDQFFMMYRTSYHDQIAGREIVPARSHPAGYTGHQARLRHDILFRNTEFDEKEETLAANPTREKFGDFTAQLQGLPLIPVDVTKQKTPTYKTTNVSRVGVLEPWATSGISAYAILSPRHNQKPLPPRPYAAHATQASDDASLEQTRRLLPTSAAMQAEAPALEAGFLGDPPPKDGKHVTLDVPSPRNYNLMSARRGMDTTREVLVSSLLGAPPSEDRPTIPVAPELSSPRGKMAYHMVSQSSAAHILGAQYSKK